MQDARRVLAVCAVPSLGWKAARALMLDGYRVVLAGPRGLPTWRLLPFCHQYEELDQLRWVARDRVGAELRDELADLCRDQDIDTVVPGDLATVALLAGTRPCGRHPFPLPDPDILEQLHDKWRFSRLATALGIQQPTTHAATDAPIDALRYPVLTKPRTMSFGAGIEWHFDRDALARWLDRQSPQVLQDAIVQEYVEGEDVSCSFLADRGRVVAVGCAVRHRGRRVFFRDRGLEETVEKVVDRVRYHGLGDLDFLATERSGEYSALEFNPRLAGGMLYYATAGLNLPGLAVQLARGESFAGVRTPRPGMTVLRPSEYMLSFAITGVVEAARRGLLPGHRIPQAIVAPVR